MDALTVALLRRAQSAAGSTPPPAFALKAHRVASFTFPNTTAWHIVPMDVLVENESPGGVEFTDENFDTYEFTQAGIWYVSGCLRPVFSAGGNPSIITASRVIQSDDNGVTWNEARCLQSVFGRARGEDEPGTERFSGTVGASVGTLIRLQGRTSDTGLTLQGWPTFDNPVSASIELHLIGTT